MSNRGEMKEGNSGVAARAFTWAFGRVVASATRVVSQGFALGCDVVGPLALGVGWVGGVLGVLKRSWPPIHAPNASA